MNEMIIIGDTHSNFDILEKVLALELERNPGIDTVLHAGDIGIYDRNSMERIPERERKILERHQTPIEQFFPYIDGTKEFKIKCVSISGNHEDFELYDSIMNDKIKIKNLRLLSQGEFAEVPFGSSSFKFIGLGKILPEGISEKKRKNVKIISEADISRVYENARKSDIDLLLLHEAPRLYSPEKKIAFGNHAITRIIRDLQPKIAFIGHMHFEYETLIGNTRIIGLGFGFDGKYGILDDDLNFVLKDINGSSPVLIEVNPAK